MKSEFQIRLKGIQEPASAGHGVALGAASVRNIMGIGKSQRITKRGCVVQRVRLAAWQRNLAF